MILSTFSVVLGNVIDLLNNKSAISTCASDNDGSSTSLVYRSQSMTHCSERHSTWGVILLRLSLISNADCVNRGIDI